MPIKTRRSPPLHLLQKLFTVQGDTLVWLAHPNKPHMDGKPFGKVAKRDYTSYRQGELWHNGEKYYCYAHRLAYMLHHNLDDLPSGMVIDHQNGNGLDNSRENIRLVSPAINAQNGRYISKLTGRKPPPFACIKKSGVPTQKERYQVVLRYNGQTIHAGKYYGDIKDAMTEAYNLSVQYYPDAERESLEHYLHDLKDLTISDST